MLKIPATTTSKWPEKSVHNLISAISFIVFAFLDLLDIILCLFYRFVDGYKEEKNTSNIPCYCGNRGTLGRSVNGDEDKEIELSETLYQRKNIFRDMGFLNKMIKKEREGSNSMKKDGLILKNRWSDCNCESCLSWQKLEDQKLHVVVKEPSQANNEEHRGKPVENWIF
ncbi:hypothetical protein BVC80_1321g66 [Macleaya cordata]|uniref:Uncharacterized protein n=1 Tax=Macleaya cordata TaxID=56857 RepID=A0A200Q0D4_MACCD|nr:hypothetical protein BVC80_1321g66 [Macleaya cordata]